MKETLDFHLATEKRFRFSMSKISDSSHKPSDSIEKNKPIKKSGENEWSNPIEFLMTCIGWK